MSYFVTLPARLQPRSSAVAMPETMFEPVRFVTTCRPSLSSRPESMLLTVVLPFVPVMATIVSGFPTYFRKSGQIFSASEPGKSVPLWCVMASAGIDSFAIHSAK